MTSDEHIQRLLQRFAAGEATDADQGEIEKLLAEGRVSLDDFPDLATIETGIHKLQSPGPSAELDRRFYATLAKEKRVKSAPWWNFLFMSQASPKFALGSIMLLLGLAAGYFLRPASGDRKLEMLSQQVSELQEVMMLSMLEKGSATERLKAVSLTQDMDEASRKVTGALIKTLNEDENVNVRLAALEALKPYARDSSVREALIRSISNQESPLVQISLAELMVALQEKAAAREFEKLVESEKTPAEVKNKLKQSIEVLI